MLKKASSKVQGDDKDSAIRAVAASSQPKGTGDANGGQDGKHIYFDGEDVELVNRNQYPSECWLQDPAILQFSALADNRMGRVNELRGGLRVRPDKVRTALVLPDRLLFVYPAANEDKRGLKVGRSKGAARVNVRSVLQPHNLLAEPGYKMRFAVEYAGDESPVGPAMVIDLTQVIEKARLPEKKSRKQHKTEQKKAAEDKEKAPQTKTDAADPPLPTNRTSGSPT